MVYGGPPARIDAEELLEERLDLLGELLRDRGVLPPHYLEGEHVERLPVEGRLEGAHFVEEDP